MVEVYGFSRDTIDGLAEKVHRLQRMLANTARQGSRQEVGVFVPKVFAGKTGGGGIAAITGNTPGSGTVTVYEIDSGGDLVIALDNTGASTTVTAYNMASTAVAGNTWVHVKEESKSKKYLCDFEDCG